MSDMHVPSSMHTARRSGVNPKKSTAAEGKVPKDRRNGDETTISEIAIMKNFLQRHRKKY